jgi:hypothetical protein
MPPRPTSLRIRKPRTVSAGAYDGKALARCS